jgi:hypothetical protein
MSNLTSESPMAELTDVLDKEDLFIPLPSNQAATFRSSAPLTPLVCDERAISRLLETLLSRSGLSAGEVARRLGISSNAVRQYLRGRRSKPSLIWFIRLAELCGARVTIEFPTKR